MRILPLYLLLVGTPLLGLVGLLRVGERIEAPSAIAGTWAVDSAFSRAVERGCFPRAFAEATAFEITQSGRFVRLTANDAAATTFEGRLDGGALVARGARAAPTTALPQCAAPRATELRLRLLDDAGTQQLAGSWGLPECAACRALPFRATRQLAG